MSEVRAGEAPGRDSDHLKLLSIFHYVLAGISAFMACFPIIHLIMGLVVVLAPSAFGHGKEAPPAWFGWLFIVIGSGFFLLGWTYAVLVFLAGRFLSRRRRYTFCFVMACIECVFVPLGTVLGGVHHFGPHAPGRETDVPGWVAFCAGGLSSGSFRRAAAERRLPAFNA